MAIGFVGFFMVLKLPPCLRACPPYACFTGVGFHNLPTYSKCLTTGKIHPIDQC